MMSRLLHKCMTKAIIANGAHPGSSLRWATSRRAFLKVLTDRLECRDWVIPYDDLEEATLFHGAGLLFPAYVLRVRTKQRTYQFGLNPWRYWRGPLPFPVTRERRSPGRTFLVWAVRGLAAAAFAYFLWPR